MKFSAANHGKSRVAAPLARPVAVWLPHLLVLWQIDNTAKFEYTRNGAKAS